MYLLICGSAGSVTRYRPVDVGFPINETALYGSNEFELASARMSARRAKAIERSWSASAPVGAMFGVRLSPVCQTRGEPVFDLP